MCGSFKVAHFAFGFDRWKRQRQQSKREKLRDVINAIVRKVGRRRPCREEGRDGRGAGGEGGH